MTHLLATLPATIAEDLAAERAELHEGSEDAAVARIAGDPRCPNCWRSLRDCSCLKSASNLQQLDDPYKHGAS